MGWIRLDSRAFVITIFLINVGLHGYSQDTAYVKRVVSILTSDSMAGRGYQEGGDLKAALFIREEFKAAGLRPVGKQFFQSVVFPVNSIKGKTVCRVDGKELIPGYDYYISARSRGVSKTYKLVRLSFKMAKHPYLLRRFLHRDFSNCFIVPDPSIARDKDLKGLYQQIVWQNEFNAAGVVITEDKPSWQISDSGKESDFIVLKIRTGEITKRSHQLSLSFSNAFVASYISQNVIGMVQGTQYPDSFIVFSAHYDHLGKMGEVIIPGANDNASGTAMMLDLARHYSLEPPPYSVVFMAFTGEEMGLLGSRYYVENPLFPLRQISVLINLDMVGTGSDGITIVNSAVFGDDYKLFDSINKADGLLKQVAIRGASANSDHHPFYAKGVKSFFIYTMGNEYKEYHSVYDRPEGLPFTAYHELFTLITRYAGLYR